MRNEVGMKFECIFEEPLGFIDIEYTHLNKTVRYEQRPHGEWIILPHSKSSMNAYKCSICGHVICCSPSHLEIYKGCYCGADMRKESDPE